MHSCDVLCVVATLAPLYTAFFFFFNDTATTEIYTLSLHDALPIYRPTGRERVGGRAGGRRHDDSVGRVLTHLVAVHRSEEHTSELQSRLHLVCRLLLEKKKEDEKDWPRPDYRAGVYSTSRPTTPTR